MICDRVLASTRPVIASTEVSYFPDLGRVSQIASGPHVRAVGWLSRDKAYPKAEPTPELIGSLLYVCPAMIGHYVRTHSYAPPVEFVDAVLATPLVGTLEYALAVAPFNRVLQTKSQGIQAVVCTLRAQLGRDKLLAYPSIQDARGLSGFSNRRCMG